MSFVDGKHGIETTASLLRNFEYQVKMDQWRVARMAYFREWKANRRQKN